MLAKKKHKNNCKQIIHNMQKKKICSDFRRYIFYHRISIKFLFVLYIIVYCNIYLFISFSILFILFQFHVPSEYQEKQLPTHAISKHFCFKKTKEINNSKVTSLISRISRQNFVVLLELCQIEALESFFSLPNSELDLAAHCCFLLLSVCQ